MKISAQDEYGLRILIRIAQAAPNEGAGIAQLVQEEGLSPSYVAKLTRTLRLGGLIQSTRGRFGGYVLSRPADQITLTQAINALGGRLYDKGFCGSHSGNLNICTNSVDCSVRSLWKVVQFKLDEVLDQVTLADLLGGEKASSLQLYNIVHPQTVRK